MMTVMIVMILQWMMINSDNYNFIIINSFMYYGLYTIRFNGMSILILVKVQRKLLLTLSTFLSSELHFIAITSSYFLILAFFAFYA